MKTWTVQCGYAAYYANTVLVEAETLCEALDKAVEKANADPGWKSLDHCGPTFIDAVAEGDTDPWNGSRSAVPVPARFAESGGPPIVMIIVSRGSVTDVWVKNGPVRVLVRDDDTEGAAADDPTVLADPDGKVFALTERSHEFPPRDAPDQPRR